MKKLLSITLILLSTLSFGQSTENIRVMSYNLLKFPEVNSGRVTDLKVILQEALPDILMVCELTSASGASAVLNNCLNQNGISYYEKANYVAGPDTENMLYYNTNKLGLVEQNVIPTSLRDINEYVLYYKSDDIATTTDTTFFYVYVCHLKASQGEEALRNDMVTDLKEYMATRPTIENVLLGGDFNLYGSSEPAWNTILYGEDVILKDPINTPGEWHADWGYADIHTQSTRTADFDGGSTGGMDDRFDFIFVSHDLTSWDNQAHIVDDSYWAYGQDGNRYNDALIDAPANTTLPSNVIQALYEMSDHLPVYMEVEVQKTYNSIVDEDHGIKAFYHGSSQEVIFSFEDPAVVMEEIEVYDLSGKKVIQVSQLTNGRLDVSKLDQGMYILRDTKYNFSLKFVR